MNAPEDDITKAVVSSTTADNGVASPSTSQSDVSGSKPAIAIAWRRPPATSPVSSASISDVPLTTRRGIEAVGKRIRIEDSEGKIVGSAKRVTDSAGSASVSRSRANTSDDAKPRAKRPRVHATSVDDAPPRITTEGVKKQRRTTSASNASANASADTTEDGRRKSKTHLKTDDLPKDVSTELRRSLYIRNKGYRMKASMALGSTNRQELLRKLEALQKEAACRFAGKTKVLRRIGKMIEDLDEDITDYSTMRSFVAATRRLYHAKVTLLWYAFRAFKSASLSSSTLRFLLAPGIVVATVSSDSRRYTFLSDGAIRRTMRHVTSALSEYLYGKKSTETKSFALNLKVDKYRFNKDSLHGLRVIADATAIETLRRAQLTQCGDRITVAELVLAANEDDHLGSSANVQQSSTDGALLTEPENFLGDTTNGKDASLTPRETTESSSERKHYRATPANESGVRRSEKGEFAKSEQLFRRKRMLPYDLATLDRILVVANIYGLQYRQEALTVLNNHVFNVLLNVTYKAIVLNDSRMPRQSKRKTREYGSADDVDSSKRETVDSRIVQYRDVAYAAETLYSRRFGIEAKPQLESIECDSPSIKDEQAYDLAYDGLQLLHEKINNALMTRMLPSELGKCVKPENSDNAEEEKGEESEEDYVHDA